MVATGVEVIWSYSAATVRVPGYYNGRTCGLADLTAGNAASAAVAPANRLLPVDLQQNCSAPVVVDVPCKDSPAALAAAQALASCSAVAAPTMRRARSPTRLLLRPLHQRLL